MIRAHVYLPPELIQEVDRLVGRRQRSQFFVDAATEKLARTKQVEALRAAAGSLADVDIPGWETSESAAAWVHTLRHADERPDGTGGDR